MNDRSDQSGWQVLLDQLKVQRRGFALAVLVGVLWTLGKVSVPLFVRTAIDRGIEKNDNQQLLLWSLLIIGSGIIAAVFTGMRRYFAVREGRRAEAEFRDRMFAHLQVLHFAYHDRTQTGELMSRANTDLLQVANLMTMLPMTSASFVTVIAVAVLLVFISPMLTLLALGGLPFVTWLGVIFSRRLSPAVMGIQRESAQVASVVEETVSGIRAVRGFGAEEGQRGRLTKEVDDLFDESISATRIRSVFLPALDLLPNVGLIAVLAYGGHQVIDGDLSLGSFVAFSVYVVMLVGPLRLLGVFIAQIQRASVSAQRVDEVLKTHPRIVDAPRAPRLPPGRGDIVFDAVEFAYEGTSGPPVLHDFNLHLRAGESVALVGPTGCGKSTVAELLPRFYDIQEGRVLLDGVDVRDVQVHDLRKAVGIVFEDTFLFSDSIAANIAFGDIDATETDIRRAATLAGAAEFIDALPLGYATEIGERGFSLSGGQRQRIAIARAILTDPRILILDDATSSVDPTKEHEIRAVLEEVMAGRTTVVIAHRPATVALADRVVLMDAGRIIAQGTHEELLATSEQYRSVLASEAPA